MEKGATVSDYMEAMNRACEFHEFVAIVSEHLMEEAALPENRLEHRNEMMTQLYRRMNYDLDRQQEDNPELLNDPLMFKDDDDLAKMYEAPNMFQRVETFVQSEHFMDECRKLYSERVQGALLEKDVYKFVDALEETIDFWRVDGDMFKMPLENTYIPVRNTIMKKPNLLD